MIARGDPGVPATPFEALLATTPTSAVESAAGAIHSGTVAKLLFTSGSTGVPKGVINTQGICAARRRLGGGPP